MGRKLQVCPPPSGRGAGGAGSSKMIRRINPMERYWNKEIECMSREDMKKLQDERLVKQVKHVWDNVPYYRKKMEEKGVTPDDIKSTDDLHKLPFLSKADLRDSYPDGLLGVPLSECVRIHSTSGTTGRRVVAYYTQKDIDMWEDCCARAITAAGGTKEDVMHVSYGYGLFTGGFGVHGGAAKVGCLTLPMSSGNTDRQIQFMMDLKSTILCCTPSYAAYLGEAMKEKGIKPEDNYLKAGIFGAEPWTEEMRQEIEKSLGIKAYDIYGLTESSGPGVAFECSEQTGMHINEDNFIAEIIDPDTGEVLPEGTKGELVFTSINKEGFPLLRYRTRDICVLSRKKCSCGRTLIKMAKPMGRSDDMLIIRGVNVFPSQIETVLIAQGYSPNYRIELDRVNNTDTFDVYVEMPADQFTDVVKEIQKKESELTNALKLILGISPKVHLVSPKTIERSEGKAVRVVDKRKLH
jgi:phenylacetate-CoA ligase